MNHNKLRPYSDIEQLFDLSVPFDWLTDASEEMGLRVAFFSPDATETPHDFRANVNVVVQHVPPLNQAEYLTLTRLQLKQVSRKASLPKDESVGETGSHIFEWVNNHTPMPLWIRQQVFFSESKAFILTATCLENQTEQLQESFAIFFDSFQTT